MAYPARLLAEDEHIVHEMRPHWRMLVLPAVLLLVIVGLWPYLHARIGVWLDAGTTRSTLRWLLAAFAVIALFFLVVQPFLRWFTSLYVITDRRIIVRRGIIAREGRDMPLSRVNDVSFSHTVLERVFNCGSIVVESAGTHGQLVIANVPNVEDMQREIYRLHQEDDERRMDEADQRSTPPAASGTEPRTAEGLPPA